MLINQLPFNKETIFDYAFRDDIYIVSIQHGRSTVPRPFGLAFKSVKNISLPDLMVALMKKEVALVQVIFEKE